MAFDGQPAEHARPAAASGRSATRCSSSTPASTRRRRSSAVLSPNGDGVAERQRARVQARPPVDRDRRSCSAPTASPRFSFTGPQRAGHVPARLAGRQGRRHAGAGGPLALGRQRDRRPGAGLDGRARPSRSTARSASPTPVAPALAVPRAAAARGRDLHADAPRATVTPRIETASRRPPPDAPDDRAPVRATLQVAWDGTTGRRRRRLLRPLRRRGDGDERARLGDAAARPSRCGGSNLGPMVARLGHALDHVVRRRPRHLRRLRC